MAPGPIYIHAGHCESYEGADFPGELRALPLAFEARAAGRRVVALTRDASAEAQMNQLFEDDTAAWLHDVTPKRAALSHESTAPPDPQGKRPPRFPAGAPSVAVRWERRQL